MDDDLVDLSVPPGLYSLADLPQRGSVAKQAFGSGWYELDQILKFYLGQFIVVTGIAGHGKSTFMLNVLLKMAMEQGIGSFLYVPENESHLRSKLRKSGPAPRRFSSISANPNARSNPRFRTRNTSRRTRSIGCSTARPGQWRIARLRS